jgi:hypothetical protein
VEPVPDRATVMLLECAAFLPPQEAQYDTFRLPVTLPAVWGAKETDKLVLRCGATVRGRLGATKLNPAPETLA